MHLQGYNKTDGNFQAGLNNLRWMTDYLLKVFMTDPTNGTPDAPEFIIIYQVGTLTFFAALPLVT